MATEHKAYILKVDGTRTDLDHCPTYSECIKIVGGYIEFAYCKTTPKITLIVDEEGCVKGKTYNKKASELYRVSSIVGDVVALEGWRTCKS